MKNKFDISSLNTFVKEVYSGRNVNTRKNIRTVKKYGISIGRAVFLFSLCLVLLYPILIMLSISFRAGSELYDPTVIWIPKNFTISNYFTIWTKLDVASALTQSGIAAIVSTIFQLISCMLAGYGFARFNFPFKKLLFGVLLLTIIVPPQVVTIPSMMDFQRFDFFGLGQIAKLFTGEAFTISLRDSLWAYFLPALLGSGIKSGLFIFIFMQFFRGLPDELQEAAYIDGCGRFKTFVVIMLPLSGAAILTVTLFSVVWYWNDSYFSVINFDGLKTVSSFLQNISASVASISGSMQEIDRGIFGAKINRIFNALNVYTDLLLLAYCFKVVIQLL